MTGEAAALVVGFLAGYAVSQSAIGSSKSKRHWGKHAVNIDATDGREAIGACVHEDSTGEVKGGLQARCDVFGPVSFT